MKAKDSIGIGILVLIIGLFFFLMASIGTSQQGATCGERTMQPGDTCMHFTNGSHTGDTNYDQQVQLQNSSTTESVLLGIVLSIAGIGFLLYGLSKSSKPTPKSSVSEPPPAGD